MTDIETGIDSAALPRVEAFVSTVVARFPGLVESVLVTGSAAMDDWHEGRSDVDLVIVTWRPIMEREADTLAQLHAEASEQTALDALYITVDQLADGPDSVPSAPQAVDGTFRMGVAGGELSWVTWLELGGAPRAEVSTEGIGPWHPAPPADPGIAERAAAFSAGNLLEYWQPLGREARRKSRFARAGEQVSAAAVAWVVLGPPRLVVTVEEHLVVSKTAAGLAAAQMFPDHAGLIARVLLWRRTGQGTFTASDAREATRLLSEAVKRGTAKPR